MKKLRIFPKLTVLPLVLLLCITALNAFSQETKPFSINESPLPAPTEPVNDFAGVIDDAVEQQINRKIKDFKARTNPAVVLAVAVVKTTGDRDIFEYSLAVARGWKIGTKEDDNPTALLFIAVDDRKYFTQVSKDLQDELPDALAGQLQRQNLVPAFKQGDYGKGVSDTIDAYIRTIDAKTGGQPTPTPDAAAQTKEQPQRGAKSSFSLCGGAPCLIILLIVMFIIFSRGGRGGRGGGNRWGGGGFGGGGVLPWIIGSAIASSIGNSSSGGGSSSDWGGSGSSSGDWGGFGGGGDFDGGGAGGSW